MKIYNLNNATEENDNVKVIPGVNYLVLATPAETERVAPQFGFVFRQETKNMKAHEDIRFESLGDYDFISLIAFDWIEGQLIQEGVHLYLGSDYLFVVAEEDNAFYQIICRQFAEEHQLRKNGRDEIVFVYYRVINRILSHMFDALCDFEEELIKMEDTILKDSNNNLAFDPVVGLKSTSFQVQKNLRLLLYVGDQIIANDNDLIPKKDLKYFHNVDTRINRLYEFSQSLHEMSTHLMSLYDSAATSRTNSLLNRLTVFTVFATPLTVISGIYGMNFANMPELDNQYGYYIVLGFMGLSLITTFIVLKKMKLI